MSYDRRLTNGSSACGGQIVPGGTSVVARSPTIRELQPDRPLRVAIATGVYNYIKDGISLTLNRLVEFLEREGAEVRIFAPTAKQPAFQHFGTLVSVPSIPLPRRPEYRLAIGLGKNARQQFADFNPDLLQISVPDILGYKSMRLAQSLGVPVVGSFHTRYDTYLKYYGLEPFKGLGMKYLRHFYGNCAQVYAPSESMADELQRANIAKDVRIWSRGVDHKRFFPARRSLQWRQSVGVKDDEVVIVFVARLVREKELVTLVKTLQELEHRGVPHRSVIVGDGPERRTMQTQLPNTIFAGFLDGEDLPVAFASSDIFLFPSDTETFGNVTLEAMASGLPVVCANATGSRSLVDDCTNGFLVTPNDPSEFANHLEMLCGDVDLRRKMASSGIEKSQAYTWDRSFQQLLSHYGQLLEST